MLQQLQWWTTLSCVCTAESLACLSEFHDRGSHPQICCDHEAPSPARRGKREAGLAPCHLVRAVAQITPSPRYYYRPGLVRLWWVFEAGDGCKGRIFAGLQAWFLQAGSQVPRCRVGWYLALVARQTSRPADSTTPHPCSNRRSTTSSRSWDWGVEAPEAPEALRGGSLHCD